MTPEQEERLILAFEQIAVTFEQIAVSLSQSVGIQALTFKRQYPAKERPAPATISRVPTEEDKLRESLGQTSETTEEWMHLEEELGPREREFLRNQERERAGGSGKTEA